jgi:hypothetical protein
MIWITIHWAQVTAGVGFALLAKPGGFITTALSDGVSTSNCIFWYRCLLGLSSSQDSTNENDKQLVIFKYCCRTASFVTSKKRVVADRPPWIPREPLLEPIRIESKLDSSNGLNRFVSTYGSKLA